jgi:phosphinothricin acetyltransferase
MTGIRIANFSDAAAMLEIYAPVVRGTAASFEEVPPSLEEFRNRIQKTLRSLPWLVCEKDSSILGYAYASPYRSRPAYRWTVETSAYVSPGFQRCGVGRALYTTLLELLRVLGCRSAVAVIAVPNAASTAMHHAVGFEEIGTLTAAGYKLGRWQDTALWQYTLQHLTSESLPSPRTLPDIQGSPEWIEAFASGEKLLRV